MLTLTTLVCVTAVPAEAQITVTPLNLDPMPEPVPALRYHLLPEVREESRGNAVQLYYRAMCPEWFYIVASKKEFYENLGEISGQPLRAITPEKAKEYAWVIDLKLLKEVDRGARRSSCDWELAERVRENGISTLLPDVQSMRSLSYLLELRAKLELKQGKFDDAARSIQTSLALGRHVGSGPVLIQGLVAVACATTGLQVVEEWVNLPDAPNLYWALTDLPHPLVDLRKAFEGERLLMDNLFPGYREMLADPTIPPPSEQQLKKTMQTLNGIQNGFAPVRESIALPFRNYSEAKRFLKEHGRTAEQVEAMPVLHAVFLYEVFKYDKYYDELRKGFGLPYPEAFATGKRASQNFRTTDSALRHDIAGELLPAVERVFYAPARIERRIAALRCIEAIRLHAAAHGGKLPQSLTDITEVPIPNDPWTGKPFEYQVNGAKAALKGAPPPGEQASSGNTINYELTIRAKKGE
jgi:hypothetical protein